MISSIRRRGVLFVLVVLPDGSRSLIPADWNDWNAEQTSRTPADDAGGVHDLGSLGDLLHLRKVIDALYGRHVESAQESRHATEPSLSRPIQASTEFLPAVPSATAWEQLDEASRLAALDILARLIARTLSTGSTREASDE